ncbi:hypothetical protein BVX98_03975, partial [bacterium F11]
FLNIPILPIGAGLRYEWANQDQSSSLSGNTFDWDLEVKNISLLVDYRIIDMAGVYLGPIVSIGMPSADFELNDAGIKTIEDLDGDNLSYSIAAEAGLRIKRYILGAEAGYQSLEIENPSSTTFNPDIDLSGFYGKIMVGVSFF